MRASSKRFQTISLAVSIFALTALLFQAFRHGWDPFGLLAAFFDLVLIVLLSVRLLRERKCNTQDPV
jgi:dolichol kinase